jgi:soluble lytic murein transglycosylase-like protein
MKWLQNAARQRVKPMHAGPQTSTLAVLALLFAGADASAGSASVDAADLCDAAAQTAAQQTGVPSDVLRALTRTETGRASGGVLRPWPWAINQGGQGQWFGTRDEMLAHIDGLLAAGILNFDVGCFQLNYRWHAQGFPSLAEMADPDRNAVYAAGYLAQKFASSGDWGQAAAAYHSGTPEHAARYLARFSAIYAGLGPQDSQAPARMIVQDADRPNLFPLLIAGQSGGGGSLVPMTAQGRSLFGRTP